MEHVEARTSLEEYVFGTLEEEQTAGIETHLSTGCAECQAALSELQELAVKMASEVPPFDPSPRVKERLLARLSTPNSKKASLGFRLPRRVWLPGLISAAAGAALLFWGIHLRQENQKLRRLLSEAEDVTSLLSSPGMQFVNLKGVDPNPQAFGKVVLDRQRGKAVVYMYRLPQTPQGKQYQLWVMREGKPTSAGVFTVAPDGSAALKLDRLPEPDGLPSFLVTIEPEGGEIAPTGMMYLTGPASPEKN
ncbi:MAG: anti-sigma factor [candidate division Zixibacteria bacterium]|nr:anti-sigma factor [candidate division Zixibacteria bacterium]MCI0596187.1 anti-sigma factor [candidate division Zixibacteria bacterium]